VWGLNNHGQLGLGDTTNRLTPERVIFPDLSTANRVVAAHSSSAILADTPFCMLVAL
jgi:hypothetical protein